MMKTLKIGAKTTAKVLLDDEDYKKVKTLTWHIAKNRYRDPPSIYFSSRINGERIYLHRFLMGLGKSNRDYPMTASNQSG